MDIPLSEFEQIIDETIRKRGFSYFKKGHVTDFADPPVPSGDAGNLRRWLRR